MQARALASSVGAADPFGIPPGRRRRGFTILELLICMAVIGVLAALLLPALSSSREAARRVSCLSNLRQLGVAIASYHEANNSLPIGWHWESTGQSAFGWAVGLLPYMEQRELYRCIDSNVALDTRSAESVRHNSVALFLCPSDITSPTFTLSSDEPSTSAPAPLFDLPTANYVGVFGTIEADDSFPAPPGDGAFLESRSINWSDMTDGLSHTIIVGERTMARVPSTWLGIDIRGEDAACRLVGSAITSPNCQYCDECEFDSRHDQGSNFLWADGHASLVGASIDTTLYQESATRGQQ